MTPARAARGALAAVLAAAATAVAATGARAAPVVVEVVGARAPGGVIRAELCTAQTFLGDGCPLSASAPVAAGAARVSFPDVPPGAWAVQLFHDVDGDGRLRRGPLGIPREGVGFSNDAPIGLSGPRFARARIEHGAAAQEVKVTLRYFGAPGL